MPSINLLANRLFQIVLCAAGLAALSGCANREERIARALNKADHARQENKPDEAISILSKAALKIPDSASIQEALAATYLESNDLHATIDSYIKAIELDEDRNRLWVNIAELRIRLGEDSTAAKALENYLASFPEDFLAWKNYAILQEKQGNTDMAIEACLQWNRIRPSAGPALRLGQLFKKSGNTPQARSWTSQAAAYVNDPGAKDALASLIELEISLQQYLPASTWLQQYESRYGQTSNDPRIQSARTTIGKWRQAQQDISDAATKLEEKRKELERQTLEARLQEEKMRREREALIAEQSRSAIEPTDTGVPATENSQPASDIETDAGEKAPTALADGSSDGTILVDAPPAPSISSPDFLMAAREAAARADYAVAVDLYWQALGPSSENPEIWYELADVYAEMRNWLDAEACILEAKRRDPRSPAIAASYLSIVSQTQDPSRVVQEAEALINLFPQDASIALVLAQTLRKGNAPRSRVASAYQSFLRKARPGEEGYDEARSYLGAAN